MLPNYGLVLPTESLNQLGAKIRKGRCNTDSLCECHMLSQISISVNWEIQQASMICKPNISSRICCTKACPNEHSNMLELGQWGFLSWGMQKNLSSSSVAYGQFSRVFWDISKGECCGALFYSPCNKLKTAMPFRSYCSCQKTIISCFWKL